MTIPAGNIRQYEGPPRIITVPPYHVHGSPNELVEGRQIQIQQWSKEDTKLLSLFDYPEGFYRPILVMRGVNYDGGGTHRAFSMDFLLKTQGDTSIAFDDKYTQWIVASAWILLWAANSREAAGVSPWFDRCMQHRRKSVEELFALLRCSSSSSGYEEWWRLRTVDELRVVPRTQ